MLASIGEFPCVDEAFYLGFCGGSKKKSNLNKPVVDSKDSTLELRKATIQKILAKKKA